MKTIKILFFFSLLFSMTSCQENHDQEKDHGKDEHQQVEKTEKDHLNHEHANKQELTLDQGEKWIANPETTEGVKNMKNLVDEYKNGTQSPTTQLGESLQNELDMIFEKCTMQGKAHDQLHLFLVPLIEMVNEIKEQEVSEDQFEEMEKHLQKYDEYFM